MDCLLMAAGTAAHASRLSCPLATYLSDSSKIMAWATFLALPMSENLYYHHGRFPVAGGVLPDAVTAYRVYGDPANPCIVFPTCYGGRLERMWLVVSSLLLLSSERTWDTRARVHDWTRESSRSGRVLYRDDRVIRKWRGVRRYLSVARTDTHHCLVIFSIQHGTASVSSRGCCWLIFIAYPIQRAVLPICLV